jgi:hypothetical protein
MVTCVVDLDALVVVVDSVDLVMGTGMDMVVTCSNVLKILWTIVLHPQKHLMYTSHMQTIVPLLVPQSQLPCQKKSKQKDRRHTRGSSRLNVMKGFGVMVVE